jgi:hypothetical protein
MVATEWWLRSRLSTECIQLLCFLSHPSLALSLLLALSFPYTVTLNGRFGAGFRLNAFDFSAASLFSLLFCVILFCSLIVLLRRRRHRFRANGRFFGADFRLNAFAFTAPSLCIFLSSSECVASASNSMAA